MPISSLYRLVLMAALAVTTPATAQHSVDSLAVRLSAMTAVSGFEQAMADTLLSMLPGSARDRAGNVVLTLGTGAPRRLVACPMDEPGFVVGRVRPDGYLTLRRVGPSPGRLADQQLEGQRITVFGRRGPVTGVVGVRSIHLTRGRPPAGEAPFTFDEAYVDIGARDAREVAGLGIAVLAPLALEKRPHRYGDGLFAAPVAGRRAACAALADAAQRAAAPDSGTTTIAFVVEQSFTRRGLASIARNSRPFDATVLLEAARTDTIASRPPAPERLGAYQVWSLPVSYAGSAVETVALADARELSRRVLAYLGGAR
ncbi:MAG: hypothetical protein OEV95_00460 [Gemmatimonadota bacterium]|nr:hypothetical protein [Gemmatimonadota bacterium]